MIPLLAITPGEFEVAALAWLSVISALLLAGLALAARVLPKLWELKTQYDNLKERTDRHRTEISTLQTNTIPATLLTTLPAAVPLLPAKAAQDIAQAVEENTEATEANTAAQQARTDQSTQ